MLASLQNETYQVHLPVFEGPLDLLLHLIEREKLDISTVSLAQIADQFLDYVKSIETVQPGTAGGFPGDGRPAGLYQVAPAAATTGEYR